MLETNLEGNLASLTDFVAKFALDDQVVTDLQELDEAVLETVIAEFDPRGDTRDVKGKLYAFAKSVANRRTAQAQVEQASVALEDFASTWGLDSTEVNWLHGLPPQVSRVLVEEFDPKEDTKDVIGKLRGFARSIQARRSTSMVGRPLSAAPAARAASHGHSAMRHRVSEFAAHWRIEENARQLLLSLPPDTQETVMSEFDPKGDTKNVSGKLIAFARSVANVRQGSQGREVVGSFAMYWGLDAGTTTFLQGLPEDAQAVVIREFDPRGGTRDINGKLRMFAKGIVNGHTQVGATRHAPEVADGFGAPVETDEVLGQSPLVNSVGSRFKAISAFVARWDLDDNAVSLLESLPGDVCATVLEEFDPRDGTRNIGGKLAAFANTVLNGKGRGKGRVSDAYGGRPQAPVRQIAAVASEAEPTEEQEDEFLMAWGLTEHEQARNVLKRLHGHVRARVMQEFAPGEGTRDVFGKFCGFANSVARTAVKEVQPMWEAPRSSTPWHRGGGQLSRSSSSADRFAEQWQLDEGARALLRGLAPEIQASSSLSSTHAAMVLLSAT